MTFSPDTLFDTLQQAARPEGYCVAYSGGMDSHVLLHAMASLRAGTGLPLLAVHVNHGMQAAAVHWSEHCRAVCRELEVDCTVLTVNARPGRGDSPEAVARDRRYGALREWLPAGHCLLTAQHQDDQAETLLLQLMRGSGVHGLAAMPVHTAFGRGSHLRPLLATPRDELAAYAARHALDWVEDPSNADTGFTRNFLRHRILPQLKQRWPNVSASLARSAVHQAEAAGLLDELGNEQLAGLSAADGSLSVPALAALSEARQRLVLRCWLRRETGAAPSSAVLERIRHDLLHSRPDAMPRIDWHGSRLQRYRGRLLIRQPETPVSPGSRLEWSPGRPLQLPDGSLLRARACTGAGLGASHLADGRLQVGWRRGGERCRPAGRAHTHVLKKLFQEQGIPPWQRERIPLLYIGEQLAAVAGLWVCHPFLAATGEQGWVIEWQAEPCAS